jgi:uncharacterized LabA/DUF88 family protein
VTKKRTLVVIDYQNIHLTGHGQWCPPGEPAHLCLVHPLYFAQHVVQVRNAVKKLAVEKNGGELDELELIDVRVFRGLPSNRHDPKNYARSLRQQSEWTKDPRCQVTYRTLKYHQEDGRLIAREKGVDVMVALALVIGAASKDYDTVVLACHDTDIEPALEMSGRLNSIETAGWMGCKRLTVSGQTFWHTALDQARFKASTDLNDYS